MNNSEESYYLAILSDHSINTEMDVRNILHSIGDKFITSLTWGIGQLEWLGERDDAFDEQIENAPNHRVVLSGKRFLELVNKKYQTLEGVFIGYQNKADAIEFLEKGWGGIDFDTSPAKIAIQVKQNFMFEIYLRSKAQADCIINTFEDVKFADEAVVN